MGGYDDELDVPRDRFVGAAAHPTHVLDDLVSSDRPRARVLYVRATSVRAAATGLHLDEERSAPADDDLDIGWHPP